MKYFVGNGIVWDKQHDRALVDFTECKNGVFGTDDQRIIDTMTKLGYTALDEPIKVEVKQPAIKLDEGEDEESDESEVKFEMPKDWPDVIALASSLGISTKGKKRDELEAEILKKKNVKKEE